MPAFLSALFKCHCCSPHVFINETRKHCRNGWGVIIARTNTPQTLRTAAIEINTSAHNALEAAHEHKTTRTHAGRIDPHRHCAEHTRVLSQLAGRSEGYIRVLRYHQIEPSVETLTICSNKLGYYAARLNASDAEDHKAWAAKLINLKALCDSAIAKQAEAVWRAPERMAV